MSKFLPLRCAVYGCDNVTYWRGDGDYAGGWMHKDIFKCKDCVEKAKGWIEYPFPGSVIGWGPLASAQREQLAQQAKEAMASMTN